MYKLVILIREFSGGQSIDEQWPVFLRQVEKMPKLRREAISRVDQFLFGDPPFSLMHELFFDSQQDAESAMASPEGKAAGKLLQQITAGRLTLFFADHKEDILENIRKYW